MEESAFELDDVSISIIEQLQEDGRRSYSAIAESVGLSDAAVRQRVKRLTDSGLLQIVGVTDPLRVGFSRQAMVGVSVSHDAVAVAEELEKLPEVTYIVHTAGSHDLLVEVVCTGDDQLFACLNKIRKVSDVVRTETFVYLKLQSSRYNWGAHSVRSTEIAT